MSPKTSSERLDQGQLSHRDTEVLITALNTAIEAYEANEKTFRQAADDIRNGKDVPMFVRGEAGVNVALGLAEEAFKKAEDARDVRDRLAPEDDGEG